VPGRIRDESIAAVRERARIDEVVREYVTLRPAGGGSLKGLCPFHDEKTPSFQVTPGRGFFFCFGCQKGGDVISFVMEIDHLTFGEAVERLAGRMAVELRYDESGRPVGGSASRNREQRTRFVEACRDAAQFYAERLGEPDAAAGRQFLAERGFDQAAAEHFGVGYSPRDGEALRRHLRGRGYSDEELFGAGLVSTGQFGSPYDRFRGRLMWPIRDLLGDVVGFGARRLHDDDRIDAKYLNTPDTVLYHKSQVLYGVDLAKKHIARRSQAVVVEGYTDVMACHLAGVTTAVATCGTAFGDDHARVLRRLLMDQDEYRGEVIFTFDGDAAGQKAALRAFEGDQRFVAQTYVAIEPDGLDPCEVRQKKGDAAVRELVARRQPLFQFAVRTMLAEHDLATGEGRTRALERTIPLIARIRDVSLRDDYARRLAGWVGAPDELEVVRRVRVAAGAGGRRGRPVAGRTPEPVTGQQSLPVVQHGDVDAVTLGTEREVLKAALQRPALAGPAFDALAADAFSSPAHAALHAAVRACGAVATQPGGPGWVAAVLAACPDDAIRGLATELSVAPLEAPDETLPRYVESLTLRLQEMWVSRRLVTVKATLQRTDPEAEQDTYNKTFADLMALEQVRRTLRERAIGGL
jgi:DNA primase